MRFVLTALALSFMLTMAHTSTAPPDASQSASTAIAFPCSTSVSPVAVSMSTDAFVRLCGEVEHARLMVFMSCPSGTALAADEAGLTSDSPAYDVVMTYTLHDTALSAPMKAGRNPAAAPSTTILNC